MRRSLPLLLAASLAAPLATSSPAFAQDGFLFRAPTLSLTVRAVHSSPRAEGEVFTFMTDELTLERGDFAAAGFGVDAGIRVNDRFDVVLGVSRVQSAQRSEFRDYIGDDDLPIEQTTKLLRVPVTAAVRWYPLPRGRSLAAHAWIPARLTPYLQVGGGLQWYRLAQEGDFVDYESLAIFRDELRSSGTSAIGQVGGGLEYWVTSNVGLSVDGRYGWSSAGLEDSFRDFDSIDLSGYQAALGLAFRL